MPAISDLPIVAARAAAYPTTWRLFAAVLFTLSRVSPPVLFAILVLGQPPLTEPLLFRLFVFLFLMPAMAAGLIRRAFTVEVEVDRDGVVMRRGGHRVEIERAAITQATVWRLPVPGPGLTLRSADFSCSLQVDDPVPLLRALAGSDATGPVLVYAQARSAVGRARWLHLAGKYGLFPLPIVLLLFRLHQYLTFGGTFGQYYIEGLRPYLSTLGYYWIMVVVNLLLYASVWRGAAEGISLLAASITPARALTARRWSERAVQVAYYAGVPALLARRFLLGD